MDEMSQIINKSLDGFDEYIEHEMQEWHVPGAAVLILRNGEVEFLKGLGYRDMEKKLPVTPKTIFPLGCFAKAFTAMAACVLAEEHKLDLNKPIKDYLPDFKLSDPFVTERATLLDVLTHRVGLPTNNFFGYTYNSFSTDDEVFKRLQYLDFSKEFRTTFQYSHIYYFIAGRVLKEITGTSWEAFIKERILDRLGMEDSNFIISDMLKGKDYALPYKCMQGEFRRTDLVNLDHYIPAASINANLIDLMKWVSLLLGNGTVNGEKIISKLSLNKMFFPQMLTRLPVRYKELLFQSYGLGWFVQPYRGYNMVFHFGNIKGYSTHITLMPDEKIGMIILTNLDESVFPNVIAYSAYDRLLGFENVEWSKRLRREAIINRETKRINLGKLKQESELVRPIEEYTGIFQNTAFGFFDITVINGNLVGKLGSLTFYIYHRKGDIFEITLDYWDVSKKITFMEDEYGKLMKLSIPCEPEVEDTIFYRVESKN